VEQVEEFRSKSLKCVNNTFVCLFKDDGQLPEFLRNFAIMLYLRGVKYPLAIYALNCLFKRNVF
jgi:hypothetical protein